MNPYHYRRLGSLSAAVCNVNQTSQNLVCLKTNLRDYDDVLFLANERMEAGQEDLSNYVFSHNERHLRDFL